MPSRKRKHRGRAVPPPVAQEPAPITERALTASAAHADAEKPRGRHSTVHLGTHRKLVDHYASLTFPNQGPTVFPGTTYEGRVDVSIGRYAVNGTVVAVADGSRDRQVGAGGFVFPAGTSNETIAEGVRSTHPVVVANTPWEYGGSSRYLADTCAALTALVVGVDIEVQNNSLPRVTAIREVEVGIDGRPVEAMAYGISGKMANAIGGKSGQNLVVVTHRHLDPVTTTLSAHGFPNLAAAEDNMRYMLKTNDPMEGLDAQVIDLSVATSNEAVARRIMPVIAQLVFASSPS